MKPNPSGLSWAKGSVPVPKVGRIDVSWKLAGTNKINIKVIHPSTIEVEVIIPEGFDGNVEIVS